jgi:acetolactate synthase-1/2/3 large subunit
MMNGQELATAVQYGAKSIIVLLNNGMYGTIRMHQEREYPQRVSGSQLRNPDFAALARAYGLCRCAHHAHTESSSPSWWPRWHGPEGTLIESDAGPRSHHHPRHAGGDHAAQALQKS